MEYHTVYFANLPDSEILQLRPMIDGGKTMLIERENVAAFSDVLDLRVWGEFLASRHPREVLLIRI